MHIEVLRAVSPIVFHEGLEVRHRILVDKNVKEVLLRSEGILRWGVERIGRVLVVH